jgi:hypothetical protein
MPVDFRYDRRASFCGGLSRVYAKWPGLYRWFGLRNAGLSHAPGLQTAPTGRGVGL